ncbi:hypothetical protein Cgig2_028737 [Carnegiea gigantea]|uniref:Uncharacterized protein n=1 Tax=Carnegiea gigantea TaxID=171969 RepID=A0A9Q1GR52_9CARY|nr:hypothetical protein Cgig2_028737 [Carnegiea gigantea]
MIVASIIVRRIFIDIGSSVDIITWDCLKKLTYLRWGILPLVRPISGFGGQEVNPTGTIRLPLRFGEKLKARNLEVDFLVVDVPTAYNIILGRPTLRKVKVVIAPYLLQLQFEADNGNTNRRPAALRVQRKKQGKSYTSGPPTIVAALIIRRLGLSIQRVGYFAFQTIPLTERWDELHFFEVPTLGLGPLALIYVVEVGLEVVILLEPCSLALAALSAPSFASASGLENASSSWHYKSFFLASMASFSSFSFFQRCWYRTMSPSSFRCSVATFTPRAKASAMVTSSSVTCSGFEVPEAAKSHDLAKS